MQQRIPRVAELVRASVASTLVRLFPQSYLTITQVDVSADLNYATVWVSQMQHEGRNPTKIMEQIAEQKSELQAQLASSLKTKFTPKLRFRFDDGSSHGRRVDELLDML